MDQISSNPNELVTKVRDEAKSLLKVADNMRTQHVDSNEEYTKQYLILPMLRVLGYTTEKFPPEVRPEYQIKLTFSKSETKNVDYAIFIDNAQTPCIFVEAKSLSCKNLDDHVAQLANYHKQEDDVKLSILTNGEEWRIYMTQDGHSSNMDETPILKVTLSSLAQNKDRLKDFIDYVARKNFASGSVNSLAEMVRNNSERDALYNTFRKLFNCDKSTMSDIIDDDFLKYILKTSNITPSKLTAQLKDSYREKVFSALQHELEVLNTTYYNKMSSERLGILDTPKPPEPNKPEPNKPEPNKPEPNKPEPNKPEPNKPKDKDDIPKYKTTEREIAIVQMISQICNAEDIRFVDDEQFITFIISSVPQDKIRQGIIPKNKGNNPWFLRFGNINNTKDISDPNHAQNGDTNTGYTNACIGFNINDKMLAQLLPGYSIIKACNAATHLPSVMLKSLNDLNGLAPAIQHCYHLFKNNLTKPST